MRNNLQSTRAWMTWIFGILVFLLCAFSGFEKIRENDFGWHLACAQYYVEHLAFPKVEPFRYTLPHFEPWKFDWIPELALYGIYLRFGPDGVILWRMLLAGLGGLTIWLVSLQRGAKPSIACLIVILLWWVIGRFFLDRPSIVVPALTGMLLWTLHRPTPGRLVAAGAIQWIWVNSHGSWPQGLLITLVLAAEAWIVRFIPGKIFFQECAHHAIRLILYLLAMLPLSLLNPNGFDAWIIFWNVVTSPEPRLYNMDATPPLLWGGRGLWTLAIGGIGAVLLLLAGLRTKRISLSDLALYAGFFWIATHVNRGVFFWALVAAAPLSMAITALWPSQRRLRHAFLALLVLITASRIVADIADRTNPPSDWGWGISEALPVKATEFLKQKNFRGNIFCAWDAGGYLIYHLPGCKISADGRFVGVEQWKIYDDLMNGKEGWQNHLPKPGEADIIVTDPNDGTPWILVLDTWGVAYWDDFWTILVRRNSPYGDWLREKEETLTAFYLVVSLYDRLTPEARQEQWKRINRRVEEDPKCGGAWFAMGYLLFRQGLETMEKDWKEAVHLWELSDSAFLADIMLNDRRVQSYYGRLWPLLMRGDVQHVERAMPSILAEYPSLRSHARAGWKSLSPILKNKYAENNEILEGLRRMEKNFPLWTENP